jgi:hypothetical protein
LDCEFDRALEQFRIAHYARVAMWDPHYVANLKRFNTEPGDWKKADRNPSAGRLKKMFLPNKANFEAPPSTTRGARISQGRVVPCGGREGKKGMQRERNRRLRSLGVAVAQRPPWAARLSALTGALCAGRKRQNAAAIPTAEKSAKLRHQKRRVNPERLKERREVHFCQTKPILAAYVRRSGCDLMNQPVAVPTNRLDILHLVSTAV